MFGFKRKSNDNDLQISLLDLQRKYSELVIKYEKLEYQVDTLKTNMNSLRGLINRKLNPEKVEQPVEEEEIETSKNPEVFLSPNGNPIKYRQGNQ